MNSILAASPPADFTFQAYREIIKAKAYYVNTGLGQLMTLPVLAEVAENRFVPPQRIEWAGGKISGIY